MAIRVRGGHPDSPPSCRDSVTTFGDPRDQRGEVYRMRDAPLKWLGARLTRNSQYIHMAGYVLL